MESQTRARTEKRHQDQKRKKALRKFMNGDISPNDFHRKHGFPPGAKCAVCSGPPVVKAIVLADAKEVQRRGMLPAPSLDGQINDAVAKTIVELRGPSGPVPHVRLSSTYACSNCRATMERALAKAPSWCVVEISEGPNPKNQVVFGYDS